MHIPTWPPVLLLAVIFASIILPILIVSFAMEADGSTPKASLDFYANRHNCRGTWQKAIPQRGSH